MMAAQDSDIPLIICVTLFYGGLNNGYPDQTAYNYWLKPAKTQAASYNAVQNLLIKKYHNWSGLGLQTMV